MNILFLKSDSNLSAKIESLLTIGKYDFVTADSFETAGNILDSGTIINLVISDLENSDNTAYDFAIYVRNSELHTSLPVLICTEVNSNPLIDKCQKFKFLTVFRNSLTEKSLQDAISIMLGDRDKTVLLVDDEAMVRDVLKTVIEREGYNVLEAVSGNNALSVLNENHVHLILSDLKMPSMSGDELLKIVKASHPEIPFYLISGFMGECTNDSLAKLGVDGLIAKPFSFAEIISSVRQGLAETYTAVGAQV